MNLSRCKGAKSLYHIQEDLSKYLQELIRGYAGEGSLISDEGYSLLPILGFKWIFMIALIDSLILRD